VNEKTMKLAISISSEEPDASFDTRFGRAAAFYFIDLETHTRQIIANPGVSASGGAGIQTAQFVAKHGVGVVISGAFGPKAFDALEATGIQMLVPPDKAGMTITEILSLYKKGELETVSNPSHMGHTGGHH
jgi:predicted Fe-Mo cluster-binding NifX family protein